MVSTLALLSASEIGFADRPDVLPAASLRACSRSRRPIQLFGSAHRVGHTDAAGLMTTGTGPTGLTSTSERWDILDTAVSGLRCTGFHGGPRPTGTARRCFDGCAAIDLASTGIDLPAVRRAWTSGRIYLQHWSRLRQPRTVVAAAATARRFVTAGGQLVDAGSSCATICASSSRRIALGSRRPRA